ncbi:MAG: hypothetical protein ACI4J0_03575 [Huintestinicola sp.]|uniref:hypothetical protein n=1 Tax=Huintestinicola sp. TaxID=2981661 RepID=UPI003F0CA5AA
MRIERTEIHRARAVMSESELSLLGLCAEELHKGSPTASLLISELVVRAFPEKGKYTVSVEIIPVRWGGCVFIMTRKPQQITVSPMIITTASAEELIRICKKIKSLSISCPESAVTGGKGYLRLIVRLPDDTLLYESLSETGMMMPADESALAKLSEHDKVVISKNAVEILSGLSH